MWRFRSARGAPPEDASAPEEVAAEEVGSAMALPPAEPSAASASGSSPSPRPSAPRSAVDVSMPLLSSPETAGASTWSSSVVGVPPAETPPQPADVSLTPSLWQRPPGFSGGGDASPGAQRRTRRVLMQDRRFQPSQIDGLTSREFEVDLLVGEKIRGEPIRVRLTKRVSYWRRCVLSVFTLGLYEVWHRCCATGSRVFDVDARLAVTSRGRLLLWTHQAAGGGLPFCQHCLRACAHPGACGLCTIVVVFVAFGPVVFSFDLLAAAGGIISMGLFAFVAVLSSWLFERASLCATTSVRQFEARDISCVRLLCYSWKSWWGLGGEVVICQVNMFFGFYPRERDLRQTLPRGAFDSYTVTPGAGGIGQAQSEGLAAKVQMAAGQGVAGGGDGKSATGLAGAASAALIVLAFAAFFNECSDLITQWANCGAKKGDGDPSAQCITDRFRQWWIDIGGGFQTVLAHWIDATDWSLQILLFFYVVGPAASLLFSTLTEQSAAGIGFIVDRRGGTATEDENFEEHWQETAAFIAELFQGANALAGPAAEAQPEPRSGAPTSDGGGWVEVPSDIPVPSSHAQPATSSGSGARPGEPANATREHIRAARSSWQQVEEMMACLIQPISGKVMVYRGVLAFLEDERVLAVYPEKVVWSILVKTKIALTCGLEYLLHWRRQRMDSAVVLSSTRLIHVSARYSRYRRSLKVDMFAVGHSVRYLAMAPPRRFCCLRPPGCLTLTSRCGSLEIQLRRMAQLRDRAQQLWQSLALLQDADSVTTLELSDFVTVLEGEPEEEQAADGAFAPPRQDAEVEAQREAAAIWGDPRPARASDGSAHRRSTGSAVGEELLEPRSAAESRGDEEQPAERGPAAPGVLSLGTAKAEKWGLVLAEGERPLWGPCLFEQEVLRRCCARRSRRRNRKRPSALVTITDRRLIVMQFQSLGPLGCWGICSRVFVTSLAVVPLRLVFGFCIQESLWLQKAMLTKLLGVVCCWPLAESTLTVQVLTNAGFGKIYLGSLNVRQRTLPGIGDAACNFEEDKVLELRRWLGNVALFFGGSAAAGAAPSDVPKVPLELWRCARGWVPG